MKKLDFERKQLSVRLEVSVHRDFLVALALDGKKTQDVLEECIKAYIQDAKARHAND